MGSAKVAARMASGHPAVPFVQTALAKGAGAGLAKPQTLARTEVCRSLANPAHLPQRQISKAVSQQGSKAVSQV